MFWHMLFEINNGEARKNAIDKGDSWG